MSNELLRIAQEALSNGDAARSSVERADYDGG